MKIPLAYGRTQIDFEYDPQQFEILATENQLNPLSDLQIGERLNNPIGANLETTIKPAESVLIVVPDATREIGCGQIVNLLVRRLIANGTMPHEINIIFATGIHRLVTEDEKREILTPFVAQRIRTLDHNPKDLMQIVRIGKTDSGIPVELNRKLTEYDHTIIIGGVGFHYFAGFTGGRKSICPGLASAKTISETHKLAFDCDKKTHRDGVGIAKLNGNPVHEAFIEVVEKCPPKFAINTFVNDRGEIVDLVCGHWKTSHEKACQVYERKNTIKLNEKRDLVIVSCGGFPHDLNLVQAHKALDMASHACKDGGTIVFLAQCENGLGRNDFADWFKASDSEALADWLCEKYQVNGQTAWSLLKKAENFDIRIVTDLPRKSAKQMRLSKIESFVDVIGTAESGYIMPFGAKFNIDPV